MSKHAKKTIAILCCIAGPIFVLSAIVSLNRLLVELNFDSDAEPTRFEVAQKKPTPQKTVKPKPKPKRKG